MKDEHDRLMSLLLPIAEFEYQTIRLKPFIRKIAQWWQDTYNEYYRAQLKTVN